MSDALTTETATDGFHATLRFRWYDRYDSEAWVLRGIERRICTLQQWFQCDGCEPKAGHGEWRDVPTEVQIRG